jgi:uncharacterized protein
MNNGNFTRRGFLSSVAAASGTALLSRPARAILNHSASTDAGAQVSAVEEKVKWKAQPFAMQDVRLMPGFWTEVMELNRSYLYSLPNERLVHNFRVTAGLPSDATPLGGWEAPDCELRGHYVGHYLSACALMHASTGDTAIRDKANALVAMLAECQQKDGYLGAYPETFYERLRNGQKVWAPFYTYHKIIAGHLDMYQLCGNKQALQTAARMADWAIAYTKPIDEEHWQKMLLVEHGGMNEAAFNLYGITGETKYRDLGYRFEHKKFFEPLAAGEDKLGGNHANTNIPKVIGAARGYELTGDERYNRISHTFWKEVVEHHSYCTGGTSNGEFWHDPDAIASQLGGGAQECCCSYNMMKLSRHLFGQEPDAKIMDYYERMLFNVRLGTQDRNGMLMYYVPLTPGLYKTFGTPFDAFWCCTGTGSEEYSKLTESIYFHDEEALYVNLFVASKVDWKQNGMRLVQKTGFPLEQKTTLTFQSAPKQKTALKVRVPYWATQGVQVKINGQVEQVSAAPSTYLQLDRNWADGDVVEIDLPMSLHIAPAPDNARVQAAMYGPLVLAARLGIEGLSTSMIYGDSGPDGREFRMPMPEIATSGTWLERGEATREYPLIFHSKGEGVTHTLVPLYQIMDERYSVYLKNTAGDAG